MELPSWSGARGLERGGGGDSATSLETCCNYRWCLFLSGSLLLWPPPFLPGLQNSLSLQQGVLLQQARALKRSPDTPLYPLPCCSKLSPSEARLLSKRSSIVTCGYMPHPVSRAQVLMAGLNQGLFTRGDEEETLCLDQATSGISNCSLHTENSVSISVLVKV